MAFSEFEIKKYEMVLGAYVESHRPPPHIRDKVDMGFRVQGQSVEIFEIRPCWQDPKDKVEVTRSESHICETTIALEGILAARGSKMASVRTCTRSRHSGRISSCHRGRRI